MAEHTSRELCPQTDEYCAARAFLTGLQTEGEVVASGNTVVLPENASLKLRALGKIAGWVSGGLRAEQNQALSDFAEEVDRALQVPADQLPTQCEDGVCGTMAAFVLARRLDMQPEAFLIKLSGPTDEDTEH